MVDNMDRMKEKIKEKEFTFADLKDVLKIYHLPITVFGRIEKLIRRDEREKLNQQWREKININFFSRFERFFRDNKHSFHGDNCSTCCDLVKEFLEKELLK